MSVNERCTWQPKEQKDVENSENSDVEPPAVSGSIKALNAFVSDIINMFVEMRISVCRLLKCIFVLQDESGGLSAYELERLENIRQNQAFLSSINLFQSCMSDDSARLIFSGCRPKATVKEVLPPRKSLRLQNKEAEILFALKVSPEKKPAGPLPMDPVNMEDGVKLLFLHVGNKGSVLMLSHRYCSALKNMRITEAQVAKVVKHRIFSAAFHPCTSSLLVAAGDKWGQIGLWNLGGDWGDDGVLLFEPHTRPVTCMAFSVAQPSQLLSLSYDGSLRCMDVQKSVFDDVYDIEDGLKTFDFMSHDCSTLVVGNFFGEVAIVDRRTPGNSHESLYCLDKTLRCVSVHPLQKHYFAVAESNIYDSRCLKKTKCPSISQLQGHTLSISSAYFSPCTGNRVLTTCMDNAIRVYDTSAMNTESPLLTSIRHNMHTGRWLSKLSAVWDPKREDCFVVGSMMMPRRVQVFHENGRPQHCFMDGENLSTVLSVTAFHPSRNALMGCNASGRVHVFSD
uniref:WD repeat-containing protein 76 n=1 Tax=Salarias fasciatus TaxID=181472 RepID=A0A672JSN5_SALFA